MTRTVRHIDSHAGVAGNSNQRPFADFMDRANIVLLGDPGAGKTYLFREAAKAEGARYLTARTFLNLPTAQVYETLLYIDGLDERRSGRHDRDTVDVITRKLFDTSPPKVRISCRAADWLGDSDLATLRAYFDQNGETAVVVLEALSREDQRDVLVGHGAEPTDALQFLSEAEARGLDDLLENPQNLLMLWQAVQTGAWPRTRTELFEISTNFMLQEADPERARAGCGTYSAKELRPVAGAICAVRLISDVEGVSLRDQECSGDIPGYRSLATFSPELVLAALSRRAFVSASEAEAVDYAHRTTAEYLAAAYLAGRIRDGLPFRRVISLIGIDGHPTPELRGLNAWLAIHLPERAEQLIDSDPYGVLTYGDAASLPTSCCAYLIRALGRLSRENPWFRSENRESSAVGALARPDMIGEMRRVLSNRDAGFGIRSIVIDALWLGTPLAELAPDLAQVLACKEYFYVERLHALLALLRMGESGRRAAAEVFRTGLGADTNGIRLRGDFIGHLYGDPCGASDVVSLVNDTLKLEETPATGLLWTLADNLPPSDLATILDQISVPKHEGGYDKRRSEVGMFYSRLLARAWRELQPTEAARVLGWLQKHHALNEALGQARVAELQRSMGEAPKLLTAVADHLISTLPEEKQPWFTLSRFRDSIFLELSADQLLGITLMHLNASEEASDRQKLLYEVAFSLMYQSKQPNARALFEMLCQYPETRPALVGLLAQWTTSPLPSHYFKAKRKRKLPNTDGKDKLQLQFDQSAELIRAGAHLGWIGHLAGIYFAIYRDVDGRLAPRQRLVQWIGEMRTETTLEGFRAALRRPDLPSLADVIRLASEHKHYDWWFGILAGMDEHWTLKHDFASLSEDHLKALVVFDATNPTPVIIDRSERRLEHAWKEELQRERPALIRDAYIAIARCRLERDESYAEGLHELLKDKSFEPDRGATAVEFLRDFTNLTSFQLGELIDAAVGDKKVHAKLLEVADEIRSAKTPADEQQRDIWLAAAFFLCPAKYQREVRDRVLTRPEFVFALRNRGRVAMRMLPTEADSTIEIMRSIAKLVGQSYPDSPFPVNGWSGDTNSWDASEYFREVVNSISSMPTQAATRALTEISEDPALSSYRPHILYALANQRQRKRETEYERPNWHSTICALENGSPATVGDLHALAIEQLLDITLRIRRENTDRYKQFWNVDSHGRIDSPRPEETCRDALVDLLRPMLLPRGVSVEPEGHMVADRRADMSIAMPGRKVLCELKRDYHVDVWTAATQQLDRFYVFDPDAKGYGIYGVFWFGAKRPREIPSPLAAKDRPVSADEMQTMLTALLPENMRERIVVIVFDVSGET